MAVLKTIQQLVLPIPEFDKDLNLIRFKAIFKLLETYTNDVIYNSEIVSEGFKTFESRVSFSETSIGSNYNVGLGTITTRLLNLETLKADKNDTFTKAESGVLVTGAVTNHNDSVTAHPFIRQKIENEVTNHNTTEASHPFILNKIGADITSHNASATSHPSIRAKITDIEGGTTVIPTYELKTNKGAANGYAPLVSGKVPAQYIPNTFDNVVEFNTYANMLAYVDKRTNVLYVVITDEMTGNDHSVYRWSGSTFFLVHDALSPSELKTMYESNTDTNAFTDALLAKVNALYTREALDALFAGIYTKTETKALFDQLKAIHGWEDSDLGTLANTGTIAHSVFAPYTFIQAEVTILNEVLERYIRPIYFVDGDFVEFATGVRLTKTNSTTWTMTGGTVTLTGVKLTPLDATKVSYNNVASQLNATEMQGAVDEVVTNAKTLDTRLTQREVIDARQDAHIKELERVARVAMNDGLRGNIDVVESAHLPSSVADGAPIEVTLEGTLLDAPQLVTNGGFSDGTTGWMASGGTISSLSNDLTYRATTTVTFPAIRPTVNTITANVKYYFISKVKVNLITPATIDMRIQDSPFNDIASQTSPTNNLYYNLSGVLSTSVNTRPRIDVSVVSGDTITVDYFYQFNISTLIANKQHSPLYNTTFDLMTDAEIQAQMDAWVSNGTLPQTVTPLGTSLDKRVSGTGKNLINPSLDLTTLPIAMPGQIRILELTLKPNTQYTLSSNILQTTLANIYFNGTSTATNGVWNGRPITATSDSNGRLFIFFRYANYVVGSQTLEQLNQAIKDGTNYIQLELGSTATPYVLYTQTQQYIAPHAVGYRLPNGVSNTVEWRNGKAYHTQRVKKYTLQASDITTFNNTFFTNYDIVSIERNALVGLVPSGSTYTSTSLFLTGYKSLGDGTGAELAGSIHFGNSFYGTLNITVRFTKGTYASLAEAQADLAGTVIYYQLAEPAPTAVNVIGNALGYRNGLVTIEDVLPRFDIYNNGLSVTTPIKALDNIVKINSDGSQTTLDKADATVAGDGLSFTHTGLANGDLVFFDYYYGGDFVSSNNVVTYFNGKDILVSPNGTVYKRVETVDNIGVITVTTEVVL